MPAIKLSHYWKDLTFLRVIPSNCVANRISIKDQNNNQIFVRGFMGINNINSTDLVGGICWGSGNPNNNGSLNGIVFSITQHPRKTKINLTYQPNNLTISHCDKIIENFFHEMSKKIYTKMVAHYKNKKNQGRYAGRRMEAHKRGTLITSGDYFNTELDNLFIQDFITEARKLNITYR
jgi:hypothetical protein